MTKRRHVPWLVSARDLTRYLGRAMDAANAGRVILFFWRPSSGGEAQMLALGNVRDAYGERVSDALRDYSVGRFERVALGRLPELTPGSHKRPQDYDDVTVRSGSRGSVIIVLPAALIAKLDLQAGDRLDVSPRRGGRLVIRPIHSRHGGGE